ncbi:MAG TPA: hypothetical protein VMU08_16910 [Rhizomicrobium sp.]|nr:hypothetical protein [Rhizomicrobium sp.]
MMLSNRWSVLALLFAVRMTIGLQYEAVAALRGIPRQPLVGGLPDGCEPADPGEALSA